MNTFIVVLCLTIAVASAYYGGYDRPSYGSHYGGYKPGFRKVANGIAAPYNNAERQQAVNYRAEHVGASSGTAKYYGVPGTGLDFGYYGGYRHGDNYGYGGYNSGSYGYSREYKGYNSYDQDNYNGH